MKKSRKLPPIIKTVGAPEWMATYSDMMSLLLTFFILLFSVSDVQTEKVFEVYKSFQVYFKLDLKKVKQLGYYPTQLSLSKIHGYLENSIRPPSNVGNRGRTRAFREDVETIDRYASLVKERNHHLISVPAAVLFERGQIRIREEAIPTLLKMAAWLRRTAMDIKIVGHTSSLPLGPNAVTDDYLTLGYLRAMEVAKFLSGETEDLAVLANNVDDESVRLIAGKIENIPFRRITVATMGNHSPNPVRRYLWEDPEKDDRVEVMFLPELGND